MESLKNIKFFGPNAKILLLPASLITVLLVLVIIGIQFAYGKISSQVVKLNEARRDAEKLEEKVEVLREFQGGLLEQTDEVVVALPDRNPAPWSISQIRRLADEHSLAITDIELGRGATATREDYRSAPLRVGFVGEVTSYVEFLKELEGVAPVTFVEEAEVDVTEDVAEAEATLKVYWATFPETLPPLTEPVKQLTQEEQELLESVAGLRQPEFVVLTPSDPSDRDNPFN